jgi:hypothetical protein
VLVRLVDFYDQIYGSKSLDEPSVTAGLTRRQNIERNMLKNGATYCYEQSLKGGLNNGEADYIRGALAVGCSARDRQLRGVGLQRPVRHPGAGAQQRLPRRPLLRDLHRYADHSRELYLTFSEPLWNYRSEKYPRGIERLHDPVFQSFYLLPAAPITMLGHNPRFGDSAPDRARPAAASAGFEPLDLHFAEMLYARSSGQTSRTLAICCSTCEGGRDEGAGQPSDKEWLLFHADHARRRRPSGGQLPSWLDRRINATNFFGQKGLTFLRTPTPRRRRQPSSASARRSTTGTTMT